MIGTGVFTTSGFLMRDLHSPPAVIAAWVIGGGTALCGALCDAELTAALPNNGAEYALLGTIYHPAVGFVAGWITLVVGFAAPIAASAIAFGVYLEKVFPPGSLPDGVRAQLPLASGLALIVITSVVHAVRVSVGSGFQNLFTGVKVALIAIFVAGGLLAGDASRLVPEGARSLGSALLSTELAVGLVFVSYAYTGWNAAAYVAGEVKVPERTLPLAFLIGTAVVTALYVGLNVVFLAAAPADRLAASGEAVAYVAA